METQKQQQINLDAVVNSAKRGLTGVIDQLYDIILQLSEENKALKAKVEQTEAKVPELKA